MNKKFKNNSRFISMLLVLALLITSAPPGFAQTLEGVEEYDGENYIYDVDNLFNLAGSTSGAAIYGSTTVTTPGALGYTFDAEKKEITGYTGTGTEIVIPDAFLVDGEVINVERIGNNAFRYYSYLGEEEPIEKITIGNNINYIGNNAFNGRKKLKEVILGKEVTTLGTSAFTSCSSLENIILNDKLTTIGNSAFNGCSKLNNVALGKEVTSLGSNAFNNCTSLTNISLNDKLESIGNTAFKGCTALEEIVLGEGIKTLGQMVFDGCTELETITLNEGLEVIGTYVIKDTKITEITIPGTVTTISDSAFNNNKYLTKIILEEGKPGVETAIGQMAFAGTAIREITIPGNVKTIGQQAFDKCTSLEDISLEEGIETIARGVFQNTAITEITIPGSVKTIGITAFGNCTLFKDVKLNEGLEDIQETAFNNTIIEEITIPSTIKTIGARIFFNNSVIRKITILKEENDENLTIAEDAFPEIATVEYKGKPIDEVKTPEELGYTFNATTKEITGYTGTETEIVIPDAFLVGEEVINVERIGTTGVFRNNASIEKVTIGNNINYIGNNAFYGCKELKEVILGENVGELALAAFRSCKKLETIYLNDNLKEIGNNVFYDCEKLDNVILGKETISLGNNAFQNCKSLKNITLNDKLTTIGNTAFNKCTALVEIVLGKSVKTLGQMVFNGCTELKTITLNEGLEEIGALVITGTKITEITIPGTVKTISDSAFNNKNLTKIVLEEGKPGVETTIGTSAFSGAAITEITIPGNVKTIGKQAFKDCTSLKNINLEEGIETISDIAFQGAVITEITIPGSVKTIGSTAFGNCMLLKDVKLNEGLEEIQSFAFNNTIIEEITIPSTIKTIGTTIFANNSVLRKITILKEENDENLTIAENAFPEGVTVIYSYSGEEGDTPEKLGYEFDAENKKITKYIGTEKTVVIPSEFTIGTDIVPVEIIGENAFEGTDIIEVTVPESVKIIDKYAFKNCTDLITVTLNEGLEKICEEAFLGTSIEKITIPSTVEKIEAFAFNNCAKLKNVNIVTYEWNIEIAENAFPEGVTVTYLTEEIEKPEDLGYEFDVKNKELTKYTGEETKIVIPSAFKIDGETVAVERIGQDAFKGTNITEVIILGNIKSIGQNAFNGIKTLEKVTLNEGLEKIEGGAFESTSLKEIIIPDSVQTIGSYAFRRCPLTNIVLNEGLKEIGSSAFSYTSIEEILIPDTVQTIGEEAFEFCKSLKAVTLCEGLKEIGKYAFRETAITEIDIPGSIDTFGSHIFHGCSNLTKATLQEGLKEIPNYFFSGTSVEEIDIPQSIRRIGNNAFFNNKNLQEINIPGNVKTVGDYAFAGCESLSSVTLNEGLEEIGAQAFAATSFTGAPIITEIIIPSTIKKLGRNIFKDNNFIEKITVMNKKENIQGAANAFPNWIEVEYIALPEEEINTPEEAGYEFHAESKTITKYLGSETKIIIPDKFMVGNDIIDVENIGNKVFASNKDIVSITVHERIKTIGELAFQKCENLKEVNLYEGLEKIGDGAFYESGIEEIKIPTTVKIIGDYAFYRCKSLSQVNLLNIVGVGQGVEEIGENAFEETGIKKITIPSSVKIIGDYAFYNCDLLMELTLSVKGLEEIGEKAFSKTSIKEVTIPSTIQNMGAGIFYECTDLSKITISYGVRELSEGLFGKTAIKEIKLPLTVSSIGNKAFSDTPLEKINISGRVRSIGEEAFIGCTDLKEVTIGEGAKEILRAAFSGTAIEEIEIPSTIEKIGAEIFSGNDVINKITVWNKKENIEVASNAFPSEEIATYKEKEDSYEGENVIVDPIFKMIINESLNRENLDTSVTKEDLGEITTINQTSRSVLYGDELWQMKSLEGIEYAVKLKNITLKGVGVDDLNPLKDLPLESIEISGGYIGKNSELQGEKSSLMDISPLSEIKTLKTLKVELTELEDITPLSELENLQILNLKDNEISYVTSLKDLPISDQLFLDGNCIADLSILMENSVRRKSYGSQRVTIIAESRLLDNPLKDINGKYFNLVENEYVANEGNNGEKLRILKLPKENQSITVQYGSESEPSTLTIKFSIIDIINDPILKKAVNLYRNNKYNERRAIDQVVTKDELEELTEFNFDYITENERKEIKDITGLEHLTKLTELNLKGTSVENLEPISNLTNLKRIFLGGSYDGSNLGHNNTKWRSPLQDISPLTGLENLEDIYVNDSEVVDISSLKDLQKLSSLYLMRNKIENAESLKDTPIAANLYLQGNCIGDLSPLQGKTALKMYGGQKVRIFPDKIEFDNPLRNVNGEYVKLIENEYVENIGDNNEKIKVLDVPEDNDVISINYGNAEIPSTLSIDVSLIRAEFEEPLQYEVKFNVFKMDGDTVKGTIDNALIQIWNENMEELKNEGINSYIWNLADGKYTYKVSFDGYVSIESSFEVKGENLSVEVKLNPVVVPDNPGNGGGGSPATPAEEKPADDSKVEEIPAELKSVKVIELEKGKIKISPDTFDGKVTLKVKEENSVLELKIVDENEKDVKIKKPIFIEMSYDEEIKNSDNITAIFIDENGNEEPVGGIYDASAGTVKFITNKSGKFIVRESSREYKDTDGVEWAKAAIESISVKGLMRGKAEDIFAPSDYITRAEFAALVSRIMKLDESTEANISFNDVTKDKWYYNSVVAVYGEGLFNGKSDEIFDPEGNITRQEMARVIGGLLEYNLIEVAGSESWEKFNDKDSIASWAQDSVSLAVKAGVILGADGNFMPDKNASRAETAVMIYRLYSLLMNK